MNNINQDMVRMIAEMREVGKLPAPCKGGDYNNKLRYIELRGQILDKFLSAFDAGYRLQISTENHPNEPLTLDELRNIGNVPVWLVWGYEISEWALIRPYNDTYMEALVFDGEGDLFRIDEYGEDWTAYYRPPEEDEENE